jgi:Bacterial Ig domain/Bacterial cadherin-like domain
MHSTPLRLTSTFSVKPLALATALAVCVPVVQAQSILDMGGNWGRVGVGMNLNGDVNGELLLRMTPRANQRAIVEVSAGEHQALGLKLSYHIAPQQFLMPGVLKGFVAFDRNATKDGKITAGLGGEVGNFFWGAYGSRGMKDTRAGVNGFGAPVVFQPYDSGLGLRAGSFVDAALLRVTLGADFERGKDGARQTTGSVLLEKYLEGSPISVGLNMEMLRRKSNRESSADDTRGTMTIRYDLQGRSPTIAESSLSRAINNPVDHKRSVDAYARATGIAPPPIGNRAPVLTDDTVTAVSGADTTFDVLANDRDPDGDALSITSVGAPQHGTATATGGKIVYKATAGYVGADAFTYTVADSKGANATGTVRVTVAAASPTPAPTPTPTPAPTPTAAPTPAPTSAVNRVPVAVADTFTVTQGSRANSLAVLNNDTDPDGDVLSVGTVSTPTNGTTAVSGKVVLYTPRAGYTGADAFTYTVTDGKGGSATGNVTITVSPTVAPTPTPTPTPAPGGNQNPKAVDDSFNVSCAAGGSTSFNVLTNDSDPDNKAGEFFVAGFTFPPSNQGTLVYLGSGDFRFTSAGVAFGTTTFQYTLNDISNGVASATVTLRCQ